MKRLKRLIIFIVAFVVIAILALNLTGNAHILEGLKHTYFRGLSKPDIDDFELVDKEIIENDTYVPWKESKLLNTYTLSEHSFDEMKLKESVSFIVMHQDSIVCEKYWGIGSKDFYGNSFSMAKSFTSMAVHACVDRSYLTVRDRVMDHLPRFGEDQWNYKLRVEHLLRMNSNIDFGESYSNPFGYQAKAYYGSDLEKETKGYRVKGHTGTLWKYQGGNTVLLAEILRRKTEKSLCEIFSDYIWTRIGCESPAYWNVDEQGFERAFSAFYAKPRDFLRLGKLYLNKGKWDGTQVLGGIYFHSAIEPVSTIDEHGEKANYYGYQFWLGNFDGVTYYGAQGMRGQYLIMIPEWDMVMLRQGHQRDERKVDGMNIDLRYYMGAAKEIFDKRNND